jgi:RimJ/RimL family protein N-acetyltransferase
LTWPEVGLYWEIASGQRRQGFAAEAGQALINYGFQHLKLRRIVAMTRFDNAASIGVMRRLGMRVERNMLPEPPWLQVVGIIESRTD